MGTAILEVQDIELDGLMSAASLVFKSGTLPGREAVRTLAARDREFAVSLEPELSGDTDERGNWLELVINGLTFDLSGLAPGATGELPEMRHTFGLPPEIRDQDLQAITLVPGPHLAGGRRLLPVLRSHAMLTARLAQLPGVEAVAWHAARCWSAPDYFRTSVMRWIEGGAFPGLGLAALMPAEDGGIASEGLALFTGQELELQPELCVERAEAARIALRLMHWLVENGPLSAVETLTAPSGENLRLEPSPDRRIIKVWKT